MDREDIFDALTLMGGSVQIRLPVELDIPASNLYPYYPVSFSMYPGNFSVQEWSARRYRNIQRRKKL